MSDPCLPRQANLTFSLASLFSSPCTRYQYKSHHCRCYFLGLCCSHALYTSLRFYDPSDAFAGTPPLWNTLARNFPPTSLLFPVTLISVSLLWPKLLTLSTALIGALGFWPQISKLSMPGMCSQQRRRSAWIHPPYHPLQTRPTLPFPHIGNIDWLLCFLPFFGNKLVTLCDQVPHYQHAPQQGACEHPVYFHQGQVSAMENRHLCTFSTFRFDESLTAICNSSLPKLRQDPKEDGWGLGDTVYVACFQVCSLE